MKGPGSVKKEFSFGSTLMPAKTWDTQANMIWTELIGTEERTLTQWRKNYLRRLSAFDGVYKHLPSIPRCLCGLDLKDSLGCAEMMGFTMPRSRNRSAREAEELRLCRPKAAPPQIGYGGPGVYSDCCERQRDPATVYEHEFTSVPSLYSGRAAERASGRPGPDNMRKTFSVFPTAWQSSFDDQGLRNKRRQLPKFTRPS